MRQNFLPLITTMLGCSRAWRTRLKYQADSRFPVVKGARTTRYPRASASWDWVVRLGRKIWVVRS